MNSRKQDLEALQENKLTALEWKDNDEEWRDGCLVMKSIDLTELSQQLKTTTALETLSINKFIIDFDNAKQLAEGLNANQSLTTLNLSHCKLGNEGTNVILAALQKHPALKVLILSRNQISSVDEVALLLTNNKLIHTLDLSSNQISDGKTLKNGMRNNKTLTVLNLEDNALEFNDICDILDAIEPTRFGILKLNGNQLGPYLLQDELDRRLNEYNTKCLLTGLALVPVMRDEEAKHQHFKLFSNHIQSEGDKESVDPVPSMSSEKSLKR